MITSTIAPAPVSPSRRRLLAYARFFKWVTLVLLILATAWLGWDCYAARKLAAVQSAYARGELSTSSDFSARGVGSERNAAPLLIAAAADAKALGTRVEMRCWSAAAGNYPFCDERRPTLAPLESILNRVDEALLRPETDWGIRYRTPLIATGVPPTADQPSLGRVVAAAAEAAAVTGDAVRALKLLMTANELADRVVQPRPDVFAMLTAGRIRASILDAAEVVIPRLDLVEARQRDLAIRLMTALADEAVERSAWDHAISFERVAAVEATTELFPRHAALLMALDEPTGIAGAVAPYVIPLMRPAWRLEGVRQFALFDQIRHAFGVEDYATARAWLPQSEATRFWTMWQRWPTSIVVPDFDRTLRDCIELRMRRRLAATAISIRLYEADQGVAPLRLDDLVPGYLTQVPADLFEPRGAAIQFQRHAPRRMIYSVGQNTLDDGGARVPRNYALSVPEGDLIFILDGQDG